ncbi:MAG: hypothetical protein QXR73_03415 [Candidatus Micrarchaeaceae archaeon]
MASKPVALALWLFLATMFLAYFIVTNNSYFILYAFPIFVVFGVLSAFSDRFTRYEIVCALAFIIAGTMLYMGKSALIYYFFFSIASFFVLYAIDMKREYKVYSYLVFALPDLLYFLGFLSNVNFAINTAIVGYYFLISAVISIFIATVASESALHKASKRFIHSRGTKLNMQYIAIVIGIALIVTPIWPVGQSLTFGAIPHAKIIINNSLLEYTTNSSDVYYPIEVNYSSLLNYTTANFSNMQFFYGNGQKINATLSQINETNNYVANLSINETSKGSHEGIYAYFMPFNYSNYTTVKIAPSSNTSSVAKSALSAITYSGSYVKRTIEIPLTSAANSTKKVNLFVVPYYTFGSFCAPGFNIKYNTSLSFSSNASFFVLRNASDFIDGISITGQSNYSNYESRISKYSFGKFLNVKSVETGFYTNKSCMFYLILTNKAITVNGSITSISQRIIGYKNVSGEFPNLYMNISRYISNKYAFLPYAFSYINSEYLNYSLNKSE